jgi:hypothetical protein
MLILTDLLTIGEIYDTQWNLLPFSWLYDTGDKIIAKPDVLDKMIDFAEQLSQPFLYVRIDLYLIQNKIHFEELTFHNGSGFEKFTPQEFDEILDDKLKLPINIL